MKVSLDTFGKIAKRAAFVLDLVEGNQGLDGKMKLELDTSSGERYLSVEIWYVDMTTKAELEVEPEAVIIKVKHAGKADILVGKKITFRDEWTEEAEEVVKDMLEIARKLDSREIEVMTTSIKKILLGD